MANESDGDQRSVLPPPDPAFRGEINVAFSDSKADFPEPLRAPEGARAIVRDSGSAGRDAAARLANRAASAPAVS